MEASNTQAPPPTCESPFAPRAVGEERRNRRGEATSRRQLTTETPDRAEKRQRERERERERAREETAETDSGTAGLFKIPRIRVCYKP